MNSFLDRVLHRARGEVMPSVHPRRPSAFEPAAGEGPRHWEKRLRSAPDQGFSGDPSHGDPANGDPPADSREILSGDPAESEGGRGRIGPGEGSPRRPGFPGPREGAPGRLPRPLPRPPTRPSLGPSPGVTDSGEAGGRDGHGASTPSSGRQVSLRSSGSEEGRGAPSKADSPSPSFPGTGSRGEEVAEGLEPAGRKGPTEGAGPLVPRSEDVPGSLRSLRIRPAHAAAIEGPGPAQPGPRGRSDHVVGSRSSPGTNGDPREGRSPGAVGHEAPAPVVQVTIGRIEIRAPAQPSPAAPPPRPAPVPEPTGGPRLGLEDYLQQRIRGER
jgi:hypothetical protein